MLNVQQRVDSSGTRAMLPIRSVSQQKCKVTISMSLIERELSLQITIVGMGSLDKSESESDESESECVDDGEIEWEKGLGFVGAR